MSKYEDGLRFGNIEGTFMRDFFALCRQGKRAVLDFVNDPEGGIAGNQEYILYELVDMKFDLDPEGSGKFIDVDFDTFCSGSPLEIAFSDKIADLKQGRINRDLARQDDDDFVNMANVITELRLL